MSAKQVVTRPGGTEVIGGLATTIGAAAGRVIFTVATGKEYDMQWITNDTTASATVGNRVMVFKILNSVGNVVYMGTSSGNVAAAQVCGSDVSFGAIVAPSTTVRRNLADTANTNVQVREGFPRMILPAGYQVVIDDLGNIDVADTMNAKWCYIAYEA